MAAHGRLVHGIPIVGYTFHLALRVTGGDGCHLSC
jgi:hypothetical protein